MPVQHFVNQDQLYVTVTQPPVAPPFVAFGRQVVCVCVRVVQSTTTPTTITTESPTSPGG